MNRKLSPSQLSVFCPTSISDGQVLFFDMSDDPEVFGGPIGDVQVSEIEENVFFFLFNFTWCLGFSV